MGRSAIGLGAFWEIAGGLGKVPEKNFIRFRSGFRQDHKKAFSRLAEGSEGRFPGLERVPGRLWLLGRFWDVLVRGRLQAKLGRSFGIYIYIKKLPNCLP